MPEIRRDQLLSNYAALVDLLESLQVQTIVRTNNGYSIQSTKLTEDSIDVDMEDFRNVQ